MLVKLIGGGPPPGGRVTTPEYEIVYVQVYNNHSALIPAGGHVCYDHLATTAQFLGWAVTRPITANLPFYAGCAPKEIPLGAWGLICVYGVMEEMGQDGGTTDTAIGNVLTPMTGSFYPGAPTAATPGQGYVFSMEAVTTVGTGRGLVRAM